MDLEAVEQGAFHPIFWSRFRRARDGTPLTPRQRVVSSAASCVKRQRTPANGFVKHESGDNLSQSSVPVDLLYRGPQLGHRSTLVWLGTNPALGG